jgi:hypothetical protein
MPSISDKPPVAQAAPSSDVRAQLALLQARYDTGAVPPSIFSIIRSLEIELSWIEHRGAESNWKQETVV